MLAKDRVFAIRAGAYTSSDIKEASFNYGYISGDTLKPGGTVAGSAKLTFTSIITSFNKLDKVYPEIGLKVGDSFEWVAMGEYFVNDINIDRNRNTTELDLMDGMFKLNQPYISDLTYPAQIRDVIREICVKTGVELETDDLGFRAIQHHIQSKADKKDITFREVLSQAIQLLGFSAFFNRKGKLEIRGLTESNITITADNYFLHGLTKSELMYQIAGITCKKDKETLTVGLRTGRSLELENSFMIQNILDDLYYDLKEIKYYPFSLDWQGHLKLDVGQWITLKTNKNETFKVPVLSQSFNFKGGLKSKISADSKAGNDTQYSYKGFLGKRIEQMSTEIEAEVQQQLEYKDKEFDEKINKAKSEINDGIEQSKAEAERYADAIKQEIDTEIAQVNQSMQAQSEEHDRQVADILSKTQSVESLANQAKSDAASALARANQVKTEAIADARAQVATVSQALNTAKSELQTAIASADQKARDSQASATALRNDLNLQASKILEQARAQTALTNRVTTVETLADGTRSTVAELSKTVNKATGDITSVTARTKTVEDTLSQTRTQYEALTQTVNTQTGQIESINRKTADLQSGIDGVTERFENLRVGGTNLFKNSDFSQGEKNWHKLPEIHNEATGKYVRLPARLWTMAQFVEVEQGEDYVISLYAKKISESSSSPRLNIKFDSLHNEDTDYVEITKTDWKRFIFKFRAKKSGKELVYFLNRNGIEVDIKNIKMEKGLLATDYSPSYEDYRSEIATYKRTAEESSAELSRQIQLADGKAVEAKTYAQQTAEGFKTRLESLESYKDAEGTRANQYLTASRTETAKQLSAERAAIATNYVAKSTYDENVRGTTLKLNEIKTTADTAKQNLATYQNTVDRKLEELTTSTQTLDGKINTASAKVDTVAGQIRTEISEVEGKIPITAGTRNLLKGTKELTDIYWTSNVTSDYYQGFRIARTAPSAATYIDTYRASTTIVPDATEYIISFYAKSSINGTPINNHFYSPNTTTRSESNTGYIGKGTDGLAIINLTTTWQRYWIKWTQTPSNTKKNVIIGRNFSANNATVEIAGVALYEGSLNKDWSPAPEDFANELSSVKTTITQTASGVEQLSTSLTTTDSKVTTAEAKIRQLISDVSSKVSQTDYNTLTGRVDSAETAITQNATEISKRLTKTQVDKAITDKGYQTKSDVDSNITGRGYITNSALQPYALATTVQNLVRETADSFSRTISETKALIPTSVGGRNLIRGSSEMIIGSGRWQDGTFRKSGTGNIKTINISNPPVPNVTKGIEVEIASATECGIAQDTLFLPKGTYTFTVWVKGPTGATGRIDTFNGSGSKSKVFKLTGGWDKVTVTNTSTVDETKNVGYVYLQNSPGYPAKMHLTAPKLEAGTIPTDYTLAIEDLATVTALHDVKDTVSSHTRTIGAVGETGSILDNVSKVTQTAAGLVQEVSGTNGLKIQVSQLAGSWAVQNLTSSGQILNQINLLANGTNRIDGRLTHITGQTLIDNGVIINAMIGNLDAGKIKTGTLDAARIRANSIDGSKIVFDQAFLNKMTANKALFKQLFAQSAFITSVQAVAVSAKQIAGGIAKALNGGMDVNFDESKINFYTNVAAIRRIYTGHPTQFIKFETEGNYSRTIIGSNRNGGEVFNSATFAGIVVENTNNINTEDNVRIYGDNTLLRHAQGDVGWNINSVTQRIVPANINAESEIWSKHFVAPDKNSKPIRLDTAVAALWDIWNHIIYNNFEFNEALRTHIKARRDNWKFELNL
ncbi:gp58-like family protein [Streptococcus suis]|uniref:gp58-like family protein n=2 Tax=Streptococcus suis TaxID=1307 RepID=UPI001D0505C0|nr:gp58-like family protein [Streptococcus suis]MDY7304028.1 gp58-like family protein [Streptococcus suis]